MKTLKTYAASEAAKTLLEQLKQIEKCETVDPKDIQKAIEQYHCHDCDYVLRSKLRELISKIDTYLFYGDCALENRVKHIEIAIGAFENFLKNKKNDD